LTCNALKLCWAYRENRVGGPSRSPQLFEPLEITVQQDLHRMLMSEWRYTANREPGRFSHKGRIRYSDRLANDLFYFLLADAIISAGYDEQRLATRLDAENYGLRYL
jgi:hypothetical protein